MTMPRSLSRWPQNIRFWRGANSLHPVFTTNMQTSSGWNEIYDSNTYAFMNQTEHSANTSMSMPKTWGALETNKTLKPCKHDYAPFFKRATSKHSLLARYKSLHPVFTTNKQVLKYLWSKPEPIRTDRQPVNKTLATSDLGCTISKSH